MCHLEARLKRLGRLADQSLKSISVPDCEILGRLLLDDFLSRRRALGDPQVLNHVLRRLNHHAALIIKSLSPRPPGDLFELANGEYSHLFAVELAKLGEENRADGNVDAHA